MEDFSAIDVHVREWLNGSDQQFKSAFHYCFPGLLQYAARFIKDHTLSEDLVMNVLLKVWQQKARMPGIDDFRSYCRNCQPAEYLCLHCTKSYCLLS